MATLRADGVRLTIKQSKKAEINKIIFLTIMSLYLPKIRNLRKDSNTNNMMAIFIPETTRIWVSPAVLNSCSVCLSI